MVKIYKQPFAHGGDTIAIPDASQPDGKMSSADGWTPDYQLPKTDPNYKPVGRQEMNGVFKEVTEALGQVQVQGSATWSADGAPYPINAQVYHNGKQWIALRANSVEPVVGADWAAIGTAATANLTTSEIDTTAGRLLKVGDFGVGGQGQNYNDFNDHTPASHFVVAGYDGGAGSLSNGAFNAPLSGVGNGIYTGFYAKGLFIDSGVHIVTPTHNSGGNPQTSTRLFSRTNKTPWVELHHTGNLLHSTGTSTEFPMSQKAVTDALGVFGQPSMTGSATLNGTTDNTVQLTGIVTTLGLEVGDVIRIQYSGYDKLHSVESITNNDLIVVNYEHAGNRGNGSLKLADQTATVTIKRIAKWYNAPIGLGQAWVGVIGSRLVNTNYTSPTNRSISISISEIGDGSMGLSVGGVIVHASSPTTNADVQIYSQIIPNAVYKVINSGGSNVNAWSELR